MKRILTVLAAALFFSSALASVARAQYSNNAGITGREVWRFDTGYLHEHREVALGISGEVVTCGAIVVLGSRHKSPSNCRRFTSWLR
jgi:hypothetical protein